MKYFALGLLLASTSCFAGKWTYGARVGMTQNGSTFVPTAAMTAEYTINKYLSWRTDAEVRFSSITRLDSLALSVPTQLLWHPLGSSAVFDPYLGPGLSASLGFDRTLTAGAHAVGGFSVHPRRGQTFGLEAKWGIPDLVRDRKPSLGLALTGNWNWQLGKM